MIPEFLDVPIFPLPNVTLFPRTLLPLHIFESRYREMIARCLKGDKMLGVALLREGWQKDYFGRPPIFKTFGVGKIVESEGLADGRYNIVLQGMYRARLIEEYTGDAFRVGRTAVLLDRAIDHLRPSLTPIQKELFEDCRRLAQAIPKLRGAIQSAWASNPHPAVIADFLAASLVADAYDRQSILEETDPLRRIKLVLVQVKFILHQIENLKEIEEEVLEEE